MLVLSLTLTQVITAWLFFEFITVPRINQGIGQFVSHLKTISAALDSIPSEQHQVFVANLAEREGIRVRRFAPEFAVNVAPRNPRFQVFRERIREFLGPDAELYVRPQNANQVFIRLKSQGIDYVVGFPRGRVERESLMPWIGLIAASLAIGVIASLGIVYRVNRPLKLLSRAAHAVGEGKDPPPVPESGPSEIRAVAREFNRMSASIRQTERDRTTFLAGVSHDLRTPLARLRLATEMLPRDVDDESRHAMVGDIDAINAVINQFLDFARDESGEPLALIDLNQRIRDSVARRVNEHVTLNLRDIPATLLRPLATQRMVDNLIDNAVKHGGGAVEIVTRTEGSTAVVEVLDRGPGIPTDQVERLKQPFARLDASRSGEAGAGLGLAIIDRIVRMHGGSFNLLPREGGGLIAEVRLPLRLPV